MRKNCRNLLFVFLCLIFASSSLQVKASHGAGGELVYQWVSDSTYRFFFKFYRDCTGIPSNTTEPLCVTPDASCTNVAAFTATMNPMNSPLPNGQNNGSVLYVGCPQYKTKCDSPNSILPGYEEWWYSCDVTLPGRCSRWSFSVSIGARNASANITGGNLYLEATLNNLVAQGNSSPFFSVKPVPYVCVNQPYAYNNGGIDPNGDSLSFQIVQPQVTNCGGSPPSYATFVTTTPSLNLTNNPFQTNNTFSLNAVTGQITFTPALTGAQTVTVLASEYRNGVLIGSSMRDVQIQVLNCTNTTVTAAVVPSTIVNAVYSSGIIKKSCGVSSFSFCYDVKAQDTTSILVVTDNHSQFIPGASITYTNNKNDSVRGCFSWTPTLSDTGLKILSVTVKDSTCRAPGVSIVQTFSFPVRVLTDVAPIVGSSLTYCQNDVSVPLTATGTNLLWYTTATGGTGSSTAPTPSTANAGTTTWYVSQTPAAGCESQRAAITVTVNPKPLPPTVTSTYGYCQNANAVPLYANGVSLKWYSVPVGGIPSTATPTPSTATAGIFKWYVSQTFNGCESNRDSIIVTVISGTTPPTAPGNVMYCEGDVAVPLTANGTSLLWYTTYTGGIGNPVAPIPSTSVLGDTYYYVSQKAGTCETQRTMIRVTVYKKVTANIQNLPDTICQYESIVVDSFAGNPSTTTYKWTISAGNSITGTGAGPYSIKIGKSGLQKIVLNMTNGKCNSADSTNVYAKPSPVASFDVKSDACVNENVTINKIIPDELSYHWFVNGNPAFDTFYKDQYIISWDSVGDNKIKLSVTGQNGCNSTEAERIVSIHKTMAQISAFSKPYFCVGDTMFVSALKGQGYIYEWKPADIFYDNYASDVSVDIKESRFIFLKVQDKWGCTSYDTAFVKTDICCDLTLPDAFTPNGNGTNDRFHIISNGHHTVLSFIIKNRWGNTVFSTGNEYDGWDGAYKGRNQDPDTYFYFIKYRCENNIVYEKKGNFILVR